ncbi:hypothetical protein DRQ05_06035 [bacterium]|nr:MAG: hypothetical protein DRQ05_06035 [bacterium]
MIAVTTEELRKLKKAELYELARKNGLKVTSRMLKSELLEALTKHFASAKVKKTSAKNSIARAKTGAGKTGASAGKKKTTPAAKTKSGAQGKANATGEKAAQKSRPRKGASQRVGRQRTRRETLARKRPIMEEVERGKYYLGMEEAPVEAVEMPSRYNIDRIVTLVRDPNWIFTYWEVTDDTIANMKDRFGANWVDCRMILRIFDRRDDRFFDIELNESARNWYINVEPAGKYQVAIGVIDPDGKFEQIAISNLVETPSGRISDVVDEKWIIPDDLFEKIFSLSGGDDMHAASIELKELLEKRLMEEVSSGGVSSFGSGAVQKAERKRGFFLRVATELILYGATDPHATVTVQGKEVKLRNDGTFSLRFALPDGKLEMPVTAVSPDEVEERTIEIKVTKGTRSKEPVMR